MAKRKKAMKILAVSDFVDAVLEDKVKNKELEPVDLIISCGDLAPEYLSFLRDRLDRPLYYVKGNHDLRYSPVNPAGCDNIHARIMRFNSLNIMGLEGSMWYNGGLNQYTETQMKKTILSMWFSLWRKGGVDIVVTHAAPRHIHDGRDLCHRGFECFVTLMKRRNPQYLVHGHIHREFSHPEERITTVNQTRVVNACGYTIIEV